MPPQLQAFLAIALWGVSFVATRAAVAEVRPLALVVARTAIGVALLVALQLRRGQSPIPPRADWRALAGMGFVGVAFHQLLQGQALTMTTAINTGWLIVLTPVWSALLAAWRLGERLTRAKLVGLACGIFGAGLVLAQGKMGAGALALPSTTGDLLVLAGTFNWAFYTVIGQSTLKRLGPLPATLGAMGFGLLMMLPVWLWQGAYADYASLSGRGWTAVIFLGVGASALGYLFWYGALERMETSKVAAFLYLEPLVTLVAAVALIGESVSAITLAGGAMVVGGVALIQRS